MSDETRRQRRDARRAAGSPVPSPALPGGGDTAGAAMVDNPAPRGGVGGFVRETVAELSKVEWPNRPQVVQGTIVVIIACAIIGAYLWGADQAFRPLVREIFLGQ